MSPRPRALEDCYRIADIHAAAESILTRDVADFIDGGAGDELTLRANEADFDRLTLAPRALRAVSSPDLGTTILGTPSALPLMLAPAGIHRLVHDEGELAVARSAAAAQIPMVVSSSSSYSWEEIAALAGTRWAQVYCFRDRGITRALLEAAAAHRYSAICLTVDVPRVGRRYRNLRNRFAIPPHIRRANMEAIRHDLAAHIDVAEYAAEHYDDTLSWSDLEWFQSVSGLPLVLKGILHAEDARQAVGCGVAGVIVSNHGGRQLDGAPSSISALPLVIEAAAGGCEVYLDGGVRRGIDIVRALALGARAVLVGRPYLWGLAAGGAEGVSRVIQLLQDELALALALLGARSVHELGRSSLS